TIDEQSFGPMHPTVAINLNNLAQLLQATNRLAEAEPLRQRALTINEQSFGPMHPTVAINLNNLAQLLQATNRLAEAEPLRQRALTINEQSFGPMHPTVAINLNNLAQLLQARRHLAVAEPLRQRALTIDEQSFGPMHPTVARDLNNLARLLQDTNRLAEAEPLRQRALTIDGSCPCRLRINPPGSPVDHHRSKKAWTRELAWLPSGPLSPGDALKVSRVDAPRRRRPLPWLLPPTRLAPPPAGCGHGGTRKSNTPRRVHTRSVSPAAIAGVRGCHVLAEPVPWVGRGCGNGPRRLARGQQKLKE